VSSSGSGMLQGEVSDAAPLTAAVNDDFTNQDPDNPTAQCPVLSVADPGQLIPQTGQPDTPNNPLKASAITTDISGQVTDDGGKSPPLNPEKPLSTGTSAKPTNPCSGLGMSNAATEKTFATGFQQLLKDWKTLTPDQRQTKIKDLANAATPAGVPDVGVHPRNMSDLGQLDFSTWRLDLNEKDLNKTQFSDADGKEFADTVYHETRHGEQWFMMAQKRAAEGQTADQISAQLGIPKSVAEAAFKNPLSAKDPRQPCADAVYESVYGGKAAARNKTLTDLDTLGDANTKAAKNYKKVSASKTSTQKQKDDADKAWGDASAKYSKVLKDYHNLPEEADAWETAGDMKKQWANTGTGKK